MIKAELRLWKEVVAVFVSGALVVAVKGSSVIRCRGGCCLHVRGCWLLCIAAFSIFSKS